MVSKLEEVRQREEDRLREACIRTVKGKRFVLTGKMFDDRRSVSSMIDSVGGIVDPRISFGTDYLVQAERECNRITTKRTAAERCGTKVISDTQLRNALRGTHPLP